MQRAMSMTTPLPDRSWLRIPFQPRIAVASRWKEIGYHRKKSCRAKKADDGLWRRGKEAELDCGRV
eukprot:1008908-Pleurochrysis_carterae.AAC.6